jgi:molybdopterin converting factor small subunit
VFRNVSNGPTVTIRVLLFASYADQLGAESVDVTVPAPALVGAIVDRVRGLPGGDGLPARPLCALNLAHVGPEAPVATGDELALLPPLAGG